MTLLDDLAAAPDNARREPRRHPDGWEPGVEWNGKDGQITAQWDHKVPDWRALLLMWDFDPDQYEIVEPVQVRTWDAPIGEGRVQRMWYHRAGIRLKRAAGPDLDALIAEIRKHKPKRLPDAEVAGRGFVAVLSDTQLGKEGTAGTVDRLLAAIDAVPGRVKELQRAGRGISSFYALSLGDLVEGCKDHYAQQTFTVELDKRAQVKLGRRLVLKAVETWAPLAPRMVLAGIGGNHGENRSDGKSYTTFADNADVEIVEQVGEILAANPTAYGHVKVRVPHEQLTMTLDIAGTIVGLAHGHQARKGPTPQARVKEWWKGQAYGFRPVGDATLMLVGHHHQFMVHQDGPRTLIMAPTIDSGSQWFAEAAGVESVPSMLTFTVGPNGWDDLKLL